MMDNTGAMSPMPMYKSHKEVWAFKIKEIKIDGEDGDSDGSVIIIPEENFAPFKVSREFISKHKPEVGGYYVKYKDGYESFSPAGAFEEGYTKV